MSLDMSEDGYAQTGTSGSIVGPGMTDRVHHNQIICNDDTFAL